MQSHPLITNDDWVHRHIVLFVKNIFFSRSFWSNCTFSGVSLYDQDLKVHFRTVFVQIKASLSRLDVHIIELSQIFECQVQDVLFWNETLQMPTLALSHMVAFHCGQCNHELFMGSVNIQ